MGPKFPFPLSSVENLEIINQRRLSSSMAIWMSSLPNWQELNEMIKIFMEIDGAGSYFQSDGWDTEPFVLTEKDGKLFGRGSTDDKVSL